MKVKINDCLIEIDQRKVSRLIRYPDGIDRMLTLTASEWAAFEMVKNHGYSFNNVLLSAIELSEFRQDDSLPKKDVISCTWFMLRVILGKIQEERAVVVNDNSAIDGYHQKNDANK